MSKGQQTNSTTSRIRALLPTTYEGAIAALPDVPETTVRCCIRALLGFKTVVKLADGTIVAGTPDRRTQLTRVDSRTATPTEREAHAEPTKSTLWAESPEQSPKVTCPAHVTVALSTCLDGYTAAAGGHRLGPIECGKCSVGRARRAQLASSVG